MLKFEDVDKKSKKHRKSKQILKSTFYRSTEDDIKRSKILHIKIKFLILIN